MCRRRGVQFVVCLVHLVSVAFGRWRKWASDADSVGLFLKGGEYGMSHGIVKAYLHDKVTRGKTALDQKVMLGSGKELNIVYIKQDGPMKKLGGGKQYAYWMIDPKWVSNSNVRFKSHKFMINMEVKTPPDVDSLEKK